MMMINVVQFQVKKYTKILFEAKRYHQAGLSSGVAEAAPLWIDVQNSRGRSANATHTPMNNLKAFGSPPCNCIPLVIVSSKKILQCSRRPPVVNNVQRILAAGCSPIIDKYNLMHHWCPNGLQLPIVWYVTIQFILQSCKWKSKIPPSPAFYNKHTCKLQNCHYSLFFSSDRRGKDGRSGIRSKEEM